MKMQFSIRKRYLRFVLPAVAVLLVLCFLMLLFSGFGFRYLFRKPLELKDLTLANAQSGTYVKVPVEELGDTFAYLGYQENGETVVDERYALHIVEGRYLIVRLTHEYVELLEKRDNANEMVANGQIGSILELNLGSFTGSLNKVNPDALTMLRKWILEHQIDPSTLTDRYLETDISTYAGAKDGDYTAYLDAVILPVQLDSGSMGGHTAGAVKVLSLLALLFLLLAILLAVSVLIGLWEKPFRTAMRLHGRKPLAIDFDTAVLFGPTLRIGQRFLWTSGTISTRILPVKDIIWAYPRSKRLEGGKLRWSLVVKTVDGDEASAKLDSENTVEQAIACLVNHGWPLVVGFDKEKQKLYKKDLAAFQGRARNGTL